MINEPRNGKGKEVVAAEFYVWLTVDTWRTQKTSVRTLSTEWQRPEHRKHNVTQP
jgi:hypothetical protein